MHDSIEKDLKWIYVTNSSYKLDERWLLPDRNVNYLLCLRLHVSQSKSSFAFGHFFGSR